MKFNLKFTRNSMQGWSSFVLMVFMVCCVTPFEPEIEKYESLLVVDGSISNLPGTTYVILSKTSTYEEIIFHGISDATVEILDDQGNSTHLVYNVKGKYLPEDIFFTGQIGRTYRVHIETSDGTIYESEPEELLQPVPLDDLKYEIVIGSDETDSGVEMQVDVLNTENREAYIYWEYAETWEFTVPYESSSAPNTRTCYRTKRPPVFKVFSTEDIVENELLDFPIYFVDITTNKLYIKYSVLVVQYTIPEQCYRFYNELLEINEDQGSLFDNIPMTLIGNIRNLTNQDQPVLGNFQVAGAESERIFISRSDIVEYLNVPSGYEHCDIQYVGESTQPGLLDSLMKAGWVVFDRVYNPIREDTILSVTNSASCFDCTKNGTNIRPDFWDDDE